MDLSIDTLLNNLKDKVLLLRNNNKDHKHYLYVEQLFEKIMNDINDITDNIKEVNDVTEDKYTTIELIKKIDANQIDKNIFFDICFYHNYLASKN
jgi:hypothetical protein